MSETGSTTVAAVQPPGLVAASHMKKRYLQSEKRLFLLVLFY